MDSSGKPTATDASNDSRDAVVADAAMDAREGGSDGTTTDVPWAGAEVGRETRLGPEVATDEVEGWVPVDVTYKQSDPAGDYFGTIRLDENGIIMDKKVWLTLDLDGSTTDLALLQNFAWYWTSTSSALVTSAYTLTSTPE